MTKLILFRPIIDMFNRKLILSVQKFLNVKQGQASLIFSRATTVIGRQTANIEKEELKISAVEPQTRENEDIADQSNTSFLETINEPWTCWWNSKSYGDHPGVSNLPCISLPEQLNSAAKLYLAKQQKEVILTVSKKLSNLLFSRRTCRQKQTLVLMPNLKRRVGPINPNTLKLTRLSEDDYAEATDHLNRVKSTKNQTSYNWKQIIYDEINAAAFLLGRSPGCYAACLRVMSEINKNVRDFKPTSMLDFGSGTGMSVWAANILWKDTLKQYYCVDSSKEMNDLAFFLFAGGDYSKVLPGLFIRHCLPVSFENRYDIVISSYSLSELPTEKERLILLKLLWEKTERYLILIEHGNFYGYYIIMEARNLLVKGFEGANEKKVKKWSKFTQPAKVFSPCPHSNTCPKWGINSCTFSQKYFMPSYINSFDKKAVPSASERFSYIVLEKGKHDSVSEETWPRVLDDPDCTTGCAVCHLCTPRGKYEHITVSKNKYGKELFYLAKKSKQGDCLPLRPKS